MPKSKIVFVYLDTFGIIGGIQKFNRAVIRALSESGDATNVVLISYYNTTADAKYVNGLPVINCNRSLSKLILALLTYLPQARLVLYGHVNLAPLANIILKMFKGAKHILFTHGIEVWPPQEASKVNFLHNVDVISSVSLFTKSVITSSYNIVDKKVLVLHNTPDPFFTFPDVNYYPQYLANRHGITNNTKVLLTITRLSATEKAKGYDTIIRSVGKLIAEGHNIKYLIGGKADAAESQRLHQLIDELGLTNQVTLLGFVPDTELAHYYQLANAFVLPSKKEGFGIVLIEAAACGTPSLAGNADGSVDAMLGGKLGELCNPDDPNDIHLKLVNLLFHRNFDKVQLQNLVIENFGFDRFKQNIEQLIK